MDRLIAKLPFWIYVLLGVFVVSVSVAAILFFSAPDTGSSGPAAVTVDVSTSTPVPVPTQAPSSTVTPTVLAVTPTSTPQIMSPPKIIKPVSPPVQPTVAITQGGGMDIPVYSYTVVNAYPHDPAAFTQGLIYLDGILYEGTGLRGQSSLRRVDLASGQVAQRYNLPANYFGEGITIFNDRIIQLTWQARRGFVYDKNTFKLQQEFTYPTEGWGITHDGKRLIMSDGSDTLYFWDPESLEEIGRVQVFDDTGPVVRLNELEYINGELFANVWQTNRIARINPETGQVTGWIVLTNLLSAEDKTNPVDVLNGIAYDFDHDRLFVTGKLWPKLFEIELVLQK